MSKKVCQIKPLEERRKNICNNKPNQTKPNQTKPNQIALTQLNMVILKKLTKWLNIKSELAASQQPHYKQLKNQSIIRKIMETSSLTYLVLL